MAIVTLLRREFIVALPLEDAWEHLARVEQWPSWAKHIRQVKVEPSGGLAAHSIGVIHLSNGIKSAFKMTQFNPHRNWKWTGGFLWLTILYDHAFEEVGPRQTRLTWTIEGKGIGVSTFGRLFAKVYSGNLDKAIPSLIQEMERPPG